MITDIADTLKNKFEVDFAVNSFGNAMLLTGANSLAKRLQNLLIMESGLPGVADVGVDIKRYIHEPATVTTLTELQNRIDSQVIRFLNSPLLVSVKADYFKTAITNQQAIAIVARIVDIADRNAITDFVLSFESAQLQNSKLVSKIYV